MQHVADLFTATAVMEGLWAAWLWWQAARVPIDSGPGANAGVQDAQDRAWTMALLVAAMRGGTLNSRAAAWTAASVALQAVATILGRLAML